jgi:hypothetical protein
MQNRMKEQKQPVTMAVRSKALSVFVRSHTGVESHSRHGCLFPFILVYVVLCEGSGLATG